MRRSAVYARSDGEGADDETEGLAGSGEGSSAQRAWRTRTSRMDALQEPVPSLVEVIRQRRADGGGGEKPWSEPRGDGATDGGGKRLWREQ